MKRLLGTYIFTLAAFAVCQTSAIAATIVSYSFGSTSASGTIVADVGSSISSIGWNSGGSEGYANTFSSQGAALSVGSFELGEYYQITLDTTGYTSISLNSFRVNGSNSAPLDWKISYSLTGVSGSYVDVSTFSISTSTAVGSTTISGFSLPVGADDNSSISIRFIATSSTRVDLTAGIASGTVRLDNISIQGTAIPEFSALALTLGLISFGFVNIRRPRVSVLS